MFTGNRYHSNLYSPLFTSSRGLGVEGLKTLFHSRNFACRGSLRQLKGGQHSTHLCASGVCRRSWAQSHLRLVEFVLESSFLFAFLWRGFFCNKCLQLSPDSFMQQRPPRFRPLAAYRPLQAGSPACAFILSGGGVAVLLQHNILSFLYIDG